MVIHKCDVCGKEMCAWLEITPQPNASDSILNIENLPKKIGPYKIGSILWYRTTYEVCNNCWNNIFTQFIEKT